MRQGLALGGLAFGAGAVLGPVRELLLAPRLGGVPAAWLEAAAMAVLLWLAAGLALRPPLTNAERAVVAGVALAVVLLAEAALSLLFQAAALDRTPRGLAEHLPGLLLLAWLLALPFLRRR
ncbi:hypothetical protein ACLF3G_04680 [Falsiroseomonas sp. HC035]|uniref:hypothetical protein n=1 Tax=Falsiroseomonas sp. HC035 TaxID=3390999 RepID=UPI003D31F1AE